MTTRSVLISGVAAFATLAGAAHAQVAAKLALDLAGAKRVTAAIEAEARKLGVSPAIAVVDDGGHLVALVRMDGAFTAAARVSTGGGANRCRVPQAPRDLRRSSTRAASP
jgi:hypothetical protein